MRSSGSAAIPGADAAPLTRALYSSDASVYRVVPAAVAIPRTSQELADTVYAALRRKVPITMRGAGTSCAGNAVGPGLVIDTAKHLNRVLDFDPATGLAVVEPGVVQARLSATGAPHGWRFGPDPSTSDRCTIGGMIGNNACGPRALGYGRTADNVVALEVITGSGELLSLDTRVDQRNSASPTLRSLRRLVQDHLGVIRPEFGRFPRQVSGYSLEHLLPEHRFAVARFLVGSEGTLGVVTRATVQLTRDLPHRFLVVLGFPTMADGADVITTVLEHRPVACEGLDARIIDIVRRRQGAAAVPDLPAGRAWLFVELTDADPELLRDRAAALVAAVPCLGAAILDEPGEATRWWRIRADGAGYAAVALERQAQAGWEDAAVPPANLGPYLRDFEALLAAHGLHGLPYGHFGDGCVHCRIDFPLDEPDGPARYRRFVLEAAALVGRYGGSMSGEHGDGRARSELLPAMYTPAALALFAKVKAIFDPHNLLNPGVLVDPRPVDADLRLAAVPAGVDAAFSAEVHRCTGVGRCVVTDGPGTMCPSYRATRQEKDSTRGRARVLQELVNGTLIRDWNSPEVAAALDLCLACKACSSECPTGVDLASLKAQVLDRAFAGRKRPASHYTLGRLPFWLGLAGRLPGAARLANLALRTPWLAGATARLAGLDRRRRLPTLTTRPASSGLSPDADPTVVVWVDCNTDGIAGGHLDAAVALLRASGQRVGVVGPGACCGLPYTSTGQLDAARRRLSAAVALLHPHAAAGRPIIGLEPSCLAVWESDAAWLLPDEPRVKAIARSVTTLAGFLDRLPDWQPPDLSGLAIVAQPHCHQRAVIGFADDQRLLARAGARVEVVDGCCGLAGSFGMEPSHYDVSVAVARLNLLPAIDAAGPEAVVLADGLSCRVQVADLAGRQATTLAELLAGRGSSR